MRLYCLPLFIGFLKRINNKTTDLQKKLDRKAEKYILQPQKKELKKNSASISRPLSGQYYPYIDSLKTSLTFLNKTPQLLSSSKILPADLQNSLNKLQHLQSKTQDADQLQQFIQPGKNQIKQYLQLLPLLVSRVAMCVSCTNNRMLIYCITDTALKRCRKIKYTIH